MKSRIIVFIIIILTLLAAYLIYNNTKSTIKANFAVEDISKVTKIFMSDKHNNSVILKKIDDEKWTVNDKYEARADGMEILLETISQVSVREPVNIAGRNNVIKWLAAKNVKVEIYEICYYINIFDKIKLFPHEKLTKVYYVGGETQDNNGTFMLMEGSDEPFICYIPGFRGFLSPRFSTLENDWRNHKIFDLKIGQLKSVKIEYPTAPDSSFEITRINKIFEIKWLKRNMILQNYDTLKVINYMSSFTNINFEAFKNNIGKKAIDSITSQYPMAIISLTDISGKVNSIKTYIKLAEEGSIDEITGKTLYIDRDRFYGLINEGKDFVFLQYFTFNQILRPITYFLKNSTQKQKE